MLFPRHEAASVRNLGAMCKGARASGTDDEEVRAREMQNKRYWDMLGDAWTGQGKKSSLALSCLCVSGSRISKGRQ